ncbi:hypothetical protein BY996DRAFT_8493168 [Phakopsora pachyrhizi]|nr:hypothetical protein BY996DRAFT_8493168 [Phakopsora pachyrhizi]
MVEEILLLGETLGAKLDPDILPANKHAPTPLEQQRLQVAKLLQDPNREVYLPKPSREKSIRPPREMMKNVQGSSAGAGSGEFHVYKQSRRREYERLRLMDENEKKEKERMEFEKKQAELKHQAESKTSKNRARRQKKKEKRKLKSKTRGTGRSKNQSDNKDSEDEKSGSEDDSDNSEAGRKKIKLGAAPTSERVLFKQPDKSGNDDEEEEEEINDNMLNKDYHQDSQGAIDEINNPSLIDAPVIEPNGLTIVEDEV